ncbi:MAG: NAD(P)H-dependent oxidoreductase subunit E [Bacillota bacterium]
MPAKQELNWYKIIPEIDRIVEENEFKEEELLEILHSTQEFIGYIPSEAQERIAKKLKVSPARVKSVISFYNHFTDQPRGKYEIALCKGTACYVKGSEKIIDKIKNKYNIEAGETTDDGLLSLEVVRCLGACGLAPVMTINGEAYGLLNPEKAVRIIEHKIQKANIEEVQMK